MYCLIAILNNKIRVSRYRFALNSTLINYKYRKLYLTGTGSVFDAQYNLFGVVKLFRSQASFGELTNI